MNTKTTRSLSSIYLSWQSEDQQLQMRIDELRKWMYEVNQLGVPHFGETASRLQPLRQRLVKHFKREDEMTTEIAKSHLISTSAVEAMRKQSSSDRDALFTELDDLVNRLNQPEPPFVSWQRAMEEVEAFVAVLEKHERREANSVKTLIPASEMG